jgi:hypothetical protein
MALGKQPSGPPASAKQVAYLQALLRAAGYADFREARHPFGLTQRQAGGKFTSREASALIDQLVDASGDEEPAPSAARPPPVEVEVEVEEADPSLARLAAEVLAHELRRRGWEVQPPPPVRSA